MDWSSWLSKTGLEPHLVHKYSLSFAQNELQYEDIASLNHECLQSMGIAVAKHRLEILKLAKKESSNVANPRSISRLFVAISKTKKSFSKYFSRLVVQDVMSSKDSPEQVRYHHHHHYQYQEHLRGAFLRKQSSDEMVRDDRPALKKALALSGPIDLRVHDRLMAHNTTKSLKLSGPLDGKLNERFMYPNKSPRLTTGSLDGKILGTERLMITTTRSPRLSGPLDGMCQDRLLVTSKSPKISGPLDGRALSPKFCSPYEKEKEEVEYDEHSLWPALFQDMKPT
ncbi:uncharacterized protein LOC133782840 [Humulus lupulus]|uniref:uncharacterized protein LOC133782840 n=1 Tax=Humulus lupulus TaxID=3486 RepID=UPI002B4141B3|nr:uncharacterized protein LOC133782840 [Humulus lupulus]